MGPDVLINCNRLLNERDMLFSEATRLRPLESFISSVIGVFDSHS